MPSGPAKPLEVSSRVTEVSGGSQGGPLDTPGRARTLPRTPPDLPGVGREVYFQHVHPAPGPMYIYNNRTSKIKQRSLQNQ